MPGDANLILIDVANLASGNDGNGSGTDPTTAPGAVIDCLEETLVGITAFYSQPTTDPPADGATLDAQVECSVDGGSTWADLLVFRQVLGSELPDDEAAGDPTLRLGAVVRTPRADTDQTDHMVQLRPVTVASTTTDWGFFMDVRSPSDIRSEWMANAQVADQN